MTFTELIAESKRRFAEHDYDGTLEIHLSPAQAVRATRELSVAKAALEAAYDDGEDVPARSGARFFACVEGVRVYVRSS